MNSDEKQTKPGYRSSRVHIHKLLWVIIYGLLWSSKYQFESPSQFSRLSNRNGVTRNSILTETRRSEVMKVDCSKKWTFTKNSRFQKVHGQKLLLFRIEARTKYRKQMEKIANICSAFHYEISTNANGTLTYICLSAF